MVSLEWYNSRQPSVAAELDCSTPCCQTGAVDRCDLEPGIAGLSLARDAEYEGNSMDRADCCWSHDDLLLN